MCKVWDMPRCARYSGADTVFVGKISAIKKPSEKRLKASDGIPEQFVYFEVETPFKNAGSKTFEIATAYDSSCAYEDISVGQRWLVFATKDEDGGLYFGKCGGSFKVGDKEDLKEAFMELPPPGDKQRLFLAVVEFGGFAPLSEARAFTEINGQKIEAVRTDDYLMFDVPKAGNYKIQVTVPYRTDLFDPYSNTVKKISASEDQSVFETEMESGTGECGFRQIRGFERVKTSSLLHYEKFLF